MERRVLSALLHSREAYDKLQPILDLSDFGDRVKIVVEQVIAFYEQDLEAKKVDIDYLCDYFQRTMPKHADMFSMLVRGLEEVSSPNIVKEYLDFKKQQIALSLSQACINNDSASIERFIEKYSSITHSEQEQEGIYVAPDLSSLIKQSSPDNLVSIYPKALNEALGGGVPEGTHIVLFARPEVGKSMVSINMAAGFLMQGKKVLYVGNEDPAPNMLMRFYSRLSGMRKAEIYQKPDEARRLSQERGIDLLVFAALSPGSIPEIRALLKQHKPDVLFLDQMTNLNCKIEGQVEKYLYLAQQIRALTKKHGLITVSVCQAGDSASNKLVLEMGDVFYSNTAIPAQADVMIGVGCNKDFEAQGRRMLSLAKNKLSGVHEPFAVSVDPTLSKVTSV